MEASSALIEAGCAVFRVAAAGAGCVAGATCAAGAGAGWANGAGAGVGTGVGAGAGWGAADSALPEPRYCARSRGWPAGTGACANAVWLNTAHTKRLQRALVAVRRVAGLAGSAAMEAGEVMGVVMGAAGGKVTDEKSGAGCEI